MKHSCNTKTITLKVNRKELELIERALAGRETYTRKLGCPSQANKYMTLFEEVFAARKEFDKV